MAGTRSRATPTRDATPTRTSARQRDKKKAKSGEVLGTVREEVLDVDDMHIHPPPVPVRVHTTNGAAGNTSEGNLTVSSNTITKDDNTTIETIVTTNVATDNR